ncbi:MAG TPA: potassium channel protein [Phycisphaerales bacterium]|nr:potassium channel protein [Phycisphaerales bacterium]
MVLRKRIYEILEPAKPNDNLSRNFDIFIISLIGLNVAALILESVESIYRIAPKIFSSFEYVSIIIFSIEYILRIWSCVENPAYRKAISGRLRFSVSFLALIDLFAILPFYLPFVGIDLRFLRAVRMMRIFRIAKIGRYSQSIKLLQRVLIQKKEQLICSVFMLLLLLIIASSAMYFTENSVQPETFSSIPATMWWAVATLTTVGYGDVYPVTQSGKLIASVIAILGIGMFALPTGILGAGFVEEISCHRKKTKLCPHCGKQIMD